MDPMRAVGRARVSHDVLWGSRWCDANLQEIIGRWSWYLLTGQHDAPGAFLPEVWSLCWKTDMCMIHHCVLDFPFTSLKGRRWIHHSSCVYLEMHARAKTRITGFLNPLNQSADLISFLRNSMNSAVSCCKSVCPSTVLCPDQHLHKPCMPLTRFQYDSAAAKAKNISETACGFRRTDV